MRLADELKYLSDSSTKLSYETIVEELIRTASEEEGVYDMYIVCEYVLDEDIARLKYEDGLHISLVNGASQEEELWKISW